MLTALFESLLWGPPMPATTPLIQKTLDLRQVLYTKEEIRNYVPQRFEFEMLDGILSLDLEHGAAAAFKQLTAHEFWVRGHVPGRPLFPGVLMIESAAQLCCFLFCKKQMDHRFFAFGGVDEVRFRGTVHPGDLFVIMAKARRIRSALGIFDTQAYVHDRLVYEGIITGMALPEAEKP